MLYKIAIYVVIFSLIPVSLSQTNKPDIPKDNWSETDFDLATYVPLDGKDPFDPSIHKQITPLGQQCSDKMNKAIYNQDIWHQFQSKAHFDNCDFEGGDRYISSLIKKMETNLNTFKSELNGYSVIPNEIADSLFTLGQIAHTIQDFYSHSNYIDTIEEESSEIKSLSQIPIIPFWTNESSKSLKGLVDKNLVSGYVFWGFPKVCKPGVPTHKEMSKDSPNTIMGAKLSIGDNKQFDIAYYLAQKSTYDLVKYFAIKYPEIRKICGDVLAFEDAVDRRGLE